MPGKLVVILMTSRPITMTAEHISMRTKGRTPCLASLDPASLDPASLELESIIGVELDNCTGTDGGAMERRSDCDLLASAIARTRAKYKRRSTKADVQKQTYKSGRTRAMSIAIV
jgi:hypothetical protein